MAQALHYAAYHGHLSSVTELLKSNPRKDAAAVESPATRRKWLGSWLVNDQLVGKCPKKSSANYWGYFISNRYLVW
jgi:ankyrin repeat protein